MTKRGDKSKRGTVDRKMRERVVRGTDAARKMIERVRELVQTAAGESETVAPVVAEASGVPPAPDASAGVADDAEVTVAPEFATITMATILERQGRHADALRVFEQLLARNPSHGEAREGRDRLRLVLRLPGVASEHAFAVSKPEPTEMLDRAPVPRGYAISQAHALPVDPTTIVVYWELTAEDVRRARHDLGADAQPALTVSSVYSEGSRFEQSDRWIEGLAASGDYFVRGVTPGAAHHATVGVRSPDGRFVAITHAEAVLTPHGRPAAVVAVERASVARDEDDATLASVVPERGVVFEQPVSPSAHVLEGTGGWEIAGVSRAPASAAHRVAPAPSAGTGSSWSAPMVTPLAPSSLAPLALATSSPSSWTLAAPSSWPGSSWTSSGPAGASDDWVSSDGWEPDK